MEAESSLQPSLSRPAYLDAGHYEREREAIFWSEWCYVGRAEQLARPGDFILAEVAGEQALVVRDGDGALRGHYNLCRHRGSRLSLADPAPAPGGAPGPSGCFGGAIVCPYHAWSYRLGGELRGAPFLGGSIPREELALHPVAVDTWGGFVFVNLSPEAAPPPLAERLGGAPARLARYPLADLRVCRRLVYEVAANWKVLAENYNECYHCGPVHPELCAVVPAFRQGGGADLPWDEGVPHAEGAYTFTLSGTSNRPLFPGLSPEERVRHKGELIYPNMMLSLSSDHVAAFMLLPRAPGRSTVVCDLLFHPEAIARPDFDPSDAADFWDLVNRQDWAICESVQAGMGSRRFEHGYYAPMEDYSLDIRRYLARRGLA